AQFPDAEHALLSGFEGLAEAGRGRHTLALEAELVDGRRGRLALPQALLVQSAGPPVWRRAAGLPAFLWRRWRERREAARGLPPLAEWPGKLRRLLLAYRPGGAAPGGFRPEAPLEPYAAWLAVNPWGERQARSLRERCAALPAGPGWAVLTAVPPGQERELLGCWEALEAQAHGDFQWRVAMDPSRVPDWLAAAARTPRVALFAPGPDAAAALNAAAGAAGGVLMLDVRDRLHPSALGELACELAASAAPWFYADDDQRPPGGGAQPRFKPDWSPVLLLSSPYCGPTLALRPGVLEAAGGVRGGYGEAWHYDLALRLAESQGPAGHVPLVLSHLGGWGPDREAAADAARALEAALARRGIRAGVRQHGWAREGRLAAFALEFPDDGPSVAVLIPTRNRPDLLGPCLRSLGATTYRNHRVIVLDNHNDDPRAAALLQAHGSVLAAPDLAGEVFSYAGLHNRAVAQVDAEHLVFLNDDTRILDPRWLSQMVGYAGLAGVGSVGARLAYPGGPLQHAGIRPGMNQGMVGHAFRMAGRDDPGPQGLAGLAREVSGGTAACLLTPRRLFLELGGFDEKAFPVGYNDVDYNWRLMDRGYACLYVPDALVEHHESATRSPLNRPSENAALRRRYRLRRDPYWSAHASPEADGLEPRPTRLAREPRRRVRVAMVS
ncbi:MAG TPA: glycosyltransferase family 2 protein, partial [bacterium]|nr:glycosyltransferase family 2 protein [bacterium]